MNRSLCFKKDGHILNTLISVLYVLKSSLNIPKVLPCKLQSLARKIKCWNHVSVMLGTVKSEFSKLVVNAPMEVVLYILYAIWSWYIEV